MLVEVGVQSNVHRSTTRRADQDDTLGYTMCRVAKEINAFLLLAPHRRVSSHHLVAMN